MQTPVVGPWTVKRLLEWTSAFFTRKQVDSPRLAAELLLSHVLKYPRIKLYTDYERPLSEKELADYRSLVQRAGEHEPIAYLTGRAHFFNLEFEVTPAVLIPRPDTETLVENVLQFCRVTARFESPRVLDLCTGSGCIAAAVAANLKTAVVVATDLSEEAVQVARRNLERLNLADRVTIEQGDLFDPISRLPDPRPFDLILANPPYIPTGEIEKLDRNVRDYEPVSALDGGIDGLVVHRRIVEGAIDRMRSGARIYLEIQFDQGPAIQEIFASHEEFDEVKLLKDYGGNIRVITARRK
jgi:release factor glutamine methyltransferase